MNRIHAAALAADALALANLTAADAALAAAQAGMSRPGRVGWKGRRAATLAAAEAAAANAAQRLRDRMAAAARAEEAAEKAAVEEAVLAAGPRWKLEDINPYFYNCGHYPKWVVRACQDGKYTDLATAREVATRRNAASSEAWSAFMA